MKILMLTPYLPFPPSSGGQVRSYNLIKHLGKNHQLHLVCLIKSNSEKKYINQLKKYCVEIYPCKRSETAWTVENIAKSILGLYPFLVVRNFSAEAKETMVSLLSDKSFDLIHAETFYIMPHIPKTDTPILLVEQTIEYRVYQHFVKRVIPFLLRPFFYYDIIKLKYWEKTFWKKANLVGAVSQNDKDEMKKLLPNLSIKIIPNAAGEDLYRIYNERKRSIDPIFLYQGNFSWLQNIEAARILIQYVFPKILEQAPHAKCIIAGQNANSKLKSYTGKGIEIVDIKPDDTQKVVDVYKNASIFLAPIEGPGGTRLKILGAMAAGLPVISSPTGIAGLDVQDTKHVLIAKSYNDFAACAVKIIENPKLFQQIRKNARNMIIKSYNWQSIARNLESAYLTLHKQRTK